MADTFDFIIIGKGMMGAAAARHLSKSGARIALVGPDEPEMWATHPGVFSSHYDNGRITRTIDPDPDWALLARRSIARYDEIAAQSGIDFYTECGCLIVAPANGIEAGHLQQVIDARDRLGVEASLLTADALQARFPFFRFPADYAGVFEAVGAGQINPRALVAAQVACAAAGGVHIVREEVTAVHDTGHSVDVVTASGQVLRGGRALVAAGGFSIADALLPDRIDLVVKARTVLFAEVSQAQLPDFDGMPSLIGSAEAQEDSYYLLAPVLYPDGKSYIKIGGDPTDSVLKDEQAVRAWFRGGASADAAAHLQTLLADVIPTLQPASLTWSPCVTSFTRHGYPYIGFTRSPRIAVLTGGNGAAAKSSDEIGRLGARLLLGETLRDEGYATGFEPGFF